MTGIRSTLNAPCQSEAARFRRHPARGSSMQGAWADTGRLRQAPAIGDLEVGESTVRRLPTGWRLFQARGSSGSRLLSHGQSGLGGLRQTFIDDLVQFHADP